MEIHGNKDTFNLENVLRQNIVNSDYYRNTCMQLSCWEDIIDEIYENVQHVEPWLSGNARGASTAFCLLYRLLTLKLAPAEIRQTLDHKDSPYIRAVGLLYLRYACDPKNLWKWFDRYIQDSEEFSPSDGGTTVTIGDYARDLLLDQYYFETIFPRIPKKINDDIIDILKARGLPFTAKGNGGQGGPDRRGLDDGSRRPASVKASLSVAFGQRAPNRAGTREEGRGRDPSLRERGREEARAKRRSPEGHRGGHDYDYGRDKDRDRSGRGYRDREQDGYRSRDYDRGGSRQREYQRSRSRSPDRRRDYGRYRENGRDARDVFKESAGDKHYGGGGGDLKSRYGDASGKLYDDEPSRSRRDYKNEEVYRLGYRR